MKTKFLSQLLRFMLVRVVDDGSGDPGDPAAADPVDLGGDPGDLDDDTGLDDLDDPIDPAPPAGTRSRQSSDDTRSEIARLNREIESLRRGAPPAASPTPNADPQFQHEEERLRAADCTDLERWQISTNRTIRENYRQTQQTMFAARDMSDRTAFQSKMTSDPRRAKYADRVETELAAARQQGRDMPREALYFYLLGKDVAEGKLKSKPRTATPPADMSRGRTPGARTDMPRGTGKGKTARERLEGIQI